MMANDRFTFPFYFYLNRGYTSQYIFHVRTPQRVLCFSVPAVLLLSKIIYVAKWNIILSLSLTLEFVGVG